MKTPTNRRRKAWLASAVIGAAGVLVGGAAAGATTPTDTTVALIVIGILQLTGAWTWVMNELQRRFGGTNLPL